MFDVGRVCIKIAGREAGRHCVVVGKDKEEGFVVITGPRTATGVRRRRCNIAHLQPLEETIDIKADVSDDELLKLYDRMKFYEKFGVERRRPFKAGPKPPTPEKKPKEEKPKEKKEEKPGKGAKKEPKKEVKKPEKKQEKKKEAKKEAEKERKPRETKKTGKEKSKLRPLKR